MDSDAKSLGDNHRLAAKVALLALLLFSTFFALFHSNSSYSSDEVWSIDAASVSLSKGLEVLRVDVHPPLYFQLLHGWIRLVGTQERAVRTLSGLFYLLSLFALYGMGKELYGKKTALLACALYITSPLAIISAQFARMYALLSLLSILSTWLYLQFSIRHRRSNLTLALYILVNILGTFTHIGFFFLLFGQIVFHVIFYLRSELKRFSFAILLSLVPYFVVWAPILVNQVTTSREGTAWVKKPGLSMLADLLLHFGGVFWLTIPVLLFVWWRSGHKPLKNFSQLINTSFPFWVMLISTATPLLISEVKPIFNSRLAIVSLHLFSLTIAALIGRASNLVLPFILVLLTTFAMFFHYPQATTCDNRSMADFIRANASDGDVVIYTSLTRLPIDYYLGRTLNPPKIYETTFPAEIDQHPGYEGRINNPARRAALEKEADELLARIAPAESSNSKLSQVFFFRGRYPEIDEILVRRLEQKFHPAPELRYKCPEDATYFSEVSRYR